jgi:hypothetical protein
LRYPSIAHKTIRILPDNDEAGLEYARTVAGIFVEANPKVDEKIVNLNDTPQPEGADFVDWYAGFVTDGKDETAVVETLKALCRRGEKVTPDVVATWTQPPESKKDSFCEIRIGRVESRHRTGETMATVPS